MTTVVDADALIGLADINDAHHTAAIRLVKELSHRNARIILLPTALAEFATIIADRIGLEQTKKAVNHLLKHYSLTEIDTRLSTHAIATYNEQTNKKNTLFDCYVMAASHILEADCIFAFDEGYKKKGFILAESFFKKKQ